LRGFDHRLVGGDRGGDLTYLGLQLIDVLLGIEALERQRFGAREVLLGGNTRGGVLRPLGLGLRLGPRRS
jgi:hypothetical protein